MSDTDYDKNCAVLERTGDGRAVGRCWFHVGPDYQCPRHGAVLNVQKTFTLTGKLTDENNIHRPTKPDGSLVSDNNHRESLWYTIKSKWYFK